MTNIIAYIRMGVGGRESETFSVEEQERAISEYAKRRKLLINVWIRDRGVPGTTPLNKRKNGNELTRVLCPNDIIICTEPGRLFVRSSEAVEHIKAWSGMKVQVHFTSLGGEVFPKSTNLILGFLKSLAYEERVSKVAATQRTKALLKGEGKVSGGRTPFGFMIDETGKCVYDPTKAEYVAFIIDNHDKGMSNRWVSRELLKKFQVQLSYNAVKRTLDRFNTDEELSKIRRLFKD